MGFIDLPCGSESHLLANEEVVTGTHASLPLRGLGAAWSSLGIALTVQFGCDKLGFHRYEPVGTHGLLREDAVIYVLNPARVPL